MKSPIYACEIAFESSAERATAINILEGIGSRYSQPIGDWLLLHANVLRIRLNSTHALGQFFQKLMQRAVTCTVEFNVKTILNPPFEPATLKASDFPFQLLG